MKRPFINPNNDEGENQQEVNQWRDILNVELDNNMQMMLDVIIDDYDTQFIVNDLPREPLRWERKTSSKVVFFADGRADFIINAIGTALNTYPTIPVMIIITAFKLVAADNNQGNLTPQRFRFIYSSREEFLDGSAAAEASGNMDEEDEFWTYYNESKDKNFKIVPQGRFIEKIELWVPEDVRERERIGGSFLPYYVNKDYYNYLSLFNRYDIYEEDKIDNKSNCFIVACSNSGIFNDSEVAFIESQINDYYVNLSKLKPLCEKLKFTIRLRYYTKTQQIKFINKGEKKVLKLFLLKIDSFNHYIIDEYIKIPYAPFTNRTFDSYEFIYESIKEGLIKKFSTEKIAEKRFGLIDKMEITIPEEPFRFSNAIVYEEKKNKENKMFFADLECIVGEDKHYPFCAIIKEENGECEEFYGLKCEQKMLDYLVKVSRKCKPIIYFHNLSYDGVFLAKYGIISSVEKNNRLYQEVIRYGKTFLTFRDSYALIPTALRNFSQMFNLENDNEKEIYPYNFITKERMYVAKLEGVGEDERPKWTCIEKAQFINNCNKLKLIEGDKWNVEKYTKFYCRRDVEILHNGFLKFVKMCTDELKLNPSCFLSLSSMAYNYFKREAYDKEKLFEYTGTMREYLRKAVYGGRCMTNRNKKIIVEDKIVDFDACSLYPSSMSRLYLPTGVPEKIHVTKETKKWLCDKVMKEEQIEADDRFISCYVVTILITKVNIDLDFPLIVKKINGVNYNVNEANVMMTIDNIYLEDLIKYQGIEYDIIDGVYWKGKKSTKLSKAIKKTYDLRNHYKREKNPMQNIYKLIMNSSYGKTIQKAALIENSYKNGQKELETFWLNNYHNIVKAEQIYDSDIYRVELRTTVDEDYTPIIIGVLILSMSKRIMNEIFDCANDSGIKIYYQDTDSIHIKKDELQTLVDNYEKKFNRTLIGNELCQFHSDFPQINNDSKDVYSSKSIFLGKKAYVDCLTDQNGNEKYLVRMKGVPEKNIIGKSVAHGGVWEMYKKLYKGEQIEFDLIEYGVHFKIYKSMQIETLKCFKRRVKFEEKEEFDIFKEKFMLAINDTEEKKVFDKLLFEDDIKNHIMKLMLMLNEKNKKSMFDKIKYFMRKCSLYAIRMNSIHLLFGKKKIDLKLITKMLFLSANDVKNIKSSSIEVNYSIKELAESVFVTEQIYDEEEIMDESLNDLIINNRIITIGVEDPNEMAKKILI